MKITPIIAILVVLSSLAYAEKTAPQPRAKKAPSHVDRKKPPVRPVTPKPETNRAATPRTKPAPGAATETAGATSPKQTPPAQNLVQGNLIGTDAAKSNTPASAHEAARFNPAPGDAPKQATDAGISKPSAQGDKGVDTKPAAWSDDWADEGVNAVRAGANAGTIKAAPGAAAQRPPDEKTARTLPNSPQPRSLTDDFGGVPLNKTPPPTSPSATPAAQPVKK